VARRAAAADRAELFRPSRGASGCSGPSSGQLDTRHYVVALAGGAVVGYAGLCDYPDEAFVQTMAVAPAARGRASARCC
jgi:ribosomal-protein-alanine N-acetyltransferase